LGKEIYIIGAILAVSLISFSLFSNEVFAQQSPEDCGPYQIFQNGQCVDIGFITITVSTDRFSYKEGDTIIISGKVSYILENFAVTLQVLSPKGLLVTVQQLDVSYSGSYSTELTAGGTLWEDSGTYTIKVLYARGDISADTSFYFSGSTGTGGTTPSIDVEGYNIGYSITGASILSIAPNVEFFELIIEISTTSDGQLTITLPRALIDAKTGGSDDVFIVIVDGVEGHFVETKTSTDRTLTIDFSYRASEIEIIGTFVVGSGGGTILDTVPPKILQPKDIVVDASDSNGAIVTYEVLAIDNEDGIVKPSCSPSSGSLFSIGDTKVVCSAFDSSGNTAPQKSFLVTVNAPSLLIPNWIKDVAAFWCNDEIDDSGFIQAIQYLIDNDVIIIPETQAGFGGTQEVPSWIKNNACWWSVGLISDSDFAQGIQWLIGQGIIRI